MGGGLEFLRCRVLAEHGVSIAPVMSTDLLRVQDQGTVGPLDPGRPAGRRGFTPPTAYAQVQSFSGSTGSFTPPDHQYPCWLELRLTATDSGGLTSTTSVRLDPKTVVLTFKTNPGGLVLSANFNDTAGTTPFAVTVVVRSSNSVSAPLSQTFNKSTYGFDSWSDGGAASHPITAPEVNTTYTATYRKR